MFSVDSTTAVRGVDKLIPVDVYIPGCPPRPEAIIDAIIKLRKKVSNESIQERSSIMQQTHRYYSTTHNMKVVAPILTGKYLQSGTREVPPLELTEAMGMPVPPALIAKTKGGSQSWLKTLNQTNLREQKHQKLPRSFRRVKSLAG
jgi:NAD(P)H-quinone oxidoreductase subunit K